MENVQQPNEERIAKIAEQLREQKAQGTTAAIAKAVDNPDGELKQAIDPTEAKKARLEVLLRQVRLRREHALTNRGRISNGKPNKDYVWVNINEHRQIEFRSQGYELCRDPDVKSDWQTQEGHHQRGDLVLYEIDKELREAMKIDQEIRAYESVEAQRHVLATAVRLAGAKPYDPQPR